MATVALSGIITPTNVVTATSTTTLTNKTLSSPVLTTPALGTPASGVVTNLTGTASININGTVGATTPSTGAFTAVTSSGVTNSFGSATNSNVANLFSGTKTGYAMLAVDSSTLSPAATGDAGIVFIQPAVGNTIQKASTGTHANFASLWVAPPAIGAGASTLTNASAIYVSSAPSGATNNYAISVGSGTSSFNGLVDISGASGGQIKFPATQNASTNANTLDDYEEGTWTPTVIGTTVAGTATYTTQTGVYTKIGQLVSVAFRVDYSGGTGSGNLRISGLPFTASNTFNRYGGLEVGDISLGAGNYAVGSVESNTTRVVISACPTGGGAGATAAYDSSGYIIFNSTYYV